jgi:hypothetical protein
MTTAQFIIAMFALVIGGLLLPLPGGARSALWLMLIVLCVLTLIGGGMQYVVDIFH